MKPVKKQNSSKVFVVLAYLILPGVHGTTYALDVKRKVGWKN